MKLTEVIFTPNFTVTSGISPGPSIGNLTEEKVFIQLPQQKILFYFAMPDITHVNFNWYIGDENTLV
jgi:hypothetical protein